ncbi:uncharacterized protein CMU_015880 [Cryptosporidium muris RN66]|uniref:Uncharacterized protein n=1 Tax=Cryptosporidium muris (strain RN66) TaxID=441375 RepID=B6ACI7_CRYMR|nr:uncharacterized protein CMU_015880 [Cryptosporidium muris RN66]EEA05841.1 hypothetical protein, conserved [Cryptosporidium muris RN66]|eukprot:XP_002140190.1 hypothetical protein [Cryptosporidium muris RN66]
MKQYQSKIRKDLLLSTGETIQISVENLGDDDIMEEKLQNTCGSNAGAGSDFFHIYRKQKEAENERIHKMELKRKEEKEQKEFDERRSDRISAFLKSTLKKSESRKKKKLKKSKQKRVIAVPK